MESHMLAQLQEKLGNLRREEQTLIRNRKTGQNLVNVQARIKETLRKIDELGAKGRLIMAICVVKVTIADPPGSTAGKTTYFKETQTITYLFHDLDDYSIYRLINAYYGDKCVSKSLIEVPLKTPIPSSLNDKFISWQIS